MARLPLSSKSDVPEAQGKPEQVTYRPGPEDPAQVKWNRHVFHANIPKMVHDQALIEKARANKFFHVGPFNPATDAVPVVETTLPKTAPQYRAWAVAWLKEMRSERELDERWAKEETLRIDCEVGADDLEYLGTLFEPKRYELRKIDRAA